MTQYGQCAWFDLFTDNIDKTKTFYTELFNWSTESMDTPVGTYTIFKTQGKAVAGATKPFHPSVANTWLAYVSVDNLDAAIKNIQTQGGAIVGQEIKMPKVGRWVLATDPQGGIFCPFEGEANAKDCSSETAFGGVGQFCWHELMCKDYKPALAFYSQVFGWTKADAIDMGPMGTYQTYNAGEKTLGGMMNNTPDMPQKTYWLEYICVDDVDQTIERAKRMGGKNTFPAMNVGNNAGRIGGLVDPNGAAFAVYANVKK